ncbi:hypothetical protein CKK33_01980 [Mucilaginibacter sp. MD40]|uniref:DUF4397 domain-containing protein n=1 Tax=Mucilaginibacter sp. MD40 TaxID=2029590 RepID=UPI000BAC59DB|nr:DUF4397 domain-containing protein [Mucilaginibacter sp. MD40]PAW92325.1 hypothetical protein CKK33_01980 [Mucilaginibacter sp. MD40]
MKKKSIYYCLMLGILTSITLFACKKNTIDPSGQFNIKVVNASATSGPQSFTLAGNVLINGGLNYMDNSAYITAPSGKNMIMEFKRPDNSVTATGSLYTADGVSFTVYLVGQGSGAIVKSYQDDLAAPNNGKVKVKFIHLSENAPSDVIVKDASGNDLVSNVSRFVASGYKYVDPGALNIQLVSLALKKDLGNFTIQDLQAGKIYTLYFTDDAGGNLVINKVLHN